jgi:DNA sulfur modification protein DndC
LRRHTSLRGAYVYAPVADFSTDDVWSYLLRVSSPWGNDNRDLAALYRSASAGECPLVIDTSTPSCGNTRFGCWVCTVAKRDTSMEALIDSGEEWMEPLLEFREWLALTTDPERKHEFRDVRGRDGRVVFTKDGTLAARTYKLEVSRQMLEKLLQAQQAVQRNGPDPKFHLISEEELHEIRRIWRTEREDWEDSVPRIFHQVNGYDLHWPIDDNMHFEAAHQLLLEGVCRGYAVPFHLVAKMLEEERRANGMARRATIQKRLEAVLAQEWRSTDAILAEQPELFSGD